MMNSFGKLFRISIFGESHGERIDVVIDGCTAGLPITIDDFNSDFNRRRSHAEGTTPRREADIPELAGGINSSEEAVKNAMEQKDSIGGIVECSANNMPIGLGEPFFDSAESLISHMIFSIPVRHLSILHGHSYFRK